MDRSNRHRLLFVVCGIVLLTTGHATTCFSMTYSGMVVDDSKRGIPGVLVAAGHGLDRTITDSAGRFSLDVAESGIRFRPRQRLLPNIVVRWNMRQRLLDLTAAPDIKAISIYRLDGARLWDVSRSSANGKTQLATPPAAPGLCIITVVRRDNSTLSWRAMQGTGGGWRTFTGSPSAESAISAASAYVNGTTLIFRHDNYFPLDRQLAEPATDLVITLQVDPAAVFFDMTKIHAFSFTLTAEDSLSMERDALAEEFVPAGLTLDGTSLGSVGLRYKGSDYYAMPRCFDEQGNRGEDADCDNVSLKVKFNEYTDTARLHGMKRLNLHSMPYDKSKLREMLAYELFRASGLYTCRTVFAKVIINGVSRGIFAGVEEIDGRFTRSRWHETGDGNLYKEIWPVYTDERRYRDALKTNEKPEDSADVGRMVEFCKAVKASTPESFTATIAPFMDLDYWLRFIVVDRAIHNADGVFTWYTGDSWLTNHNYYFYEDEAPGGKFWLIPWDMNATFSKTDPIFDDLGVPEWNVKPDSCAPMEVWSGSFAIPPNCDKLTNLTAAVCWNRFVSLGDQFLEELFSPERMKKRIDAWAKVVEPEMGSDPFVEKEAWAENVEWLRSLMTSLHTGFYKYLHPGVEAADTAGYTTPFPGDSGFSPVLLNNFEFGAEVAIDSWAHAYVSDNSGIELYRDTVLPLGGLADLRCAFSFRPDSLEKEFSEWAMVKLNFKEKRDCSGVSGLQISLKSDITRQINIGLSSDVYKRNGVDDGAWYCWVVAAGPKTRQVTLDIRDIDYPDWVTHDRPELLDSVLAGLSGIWISPGPFFGGDGELQAVPDSGYFKIDNIRLVGAME